MHKIMLYSTIFLLVVTYIGYSSAIPVKHLQLPSYIKPCSKSAANFEQCALEYATEALPAILKGDREYNIPELNPLVLPTVELETNGFKITITDLQIFGLDKTEFKQVKFDLESKTLTIKLYFDRLSLVGHYICDGKILVMPIQGDGNINITITSMDVQYIEKYNVEEIEGEEYLIFKNPAKVDYTIGRAYIDIENLFGGNKELGDATLMAINKDWAQVAEFLKPMITETISSIATGVAGSVASSVPLKYIFLD